MMVIMKGNRYDIIRSQERKEHSDVTFVWSGGDRLFDWGVYFVMLLIPVYINHICIYTHSNLCNFSRLVVDIIIHTCAQDWNNLFL